jgi:hypothetical protein
MRERHFQEVPDMIRRAATVHRAVVQQRSLSVALFRRTSKLIAIILMSGSLGGCGSISSFVAGSMGDYIPAWAGGLPADAPPRPGTPQYEEWLKQHPQHGEAAKDARGVAPTSAEAIH